MVIWREKRTRSRAGQNLSCFIYSFEVFRARAKALMGNSRWIDPRSRKIIHDLMEL